jgi:hypothetical protein
MEVPEWLKKVQENIAKSEIQQIFADEAFVMGTVKVGKGSDGKIKKEGTIRIAFIDMTTMQPVSKLVVTLSTARGLINALNAQVVKLEKDLESKETPKKTSAEPSLTYIG